MKIFKKVFALLVVAVIIFSNSVWTYAADTEECESRQVSLIEAENVAVSHIQSVMALDESSAWNNGVRIKVRKALFDLEDEIEAYYFGLVDKKGEAGGYVIVSADTSEIPILEYSQEGQSFIDISIEKTKKQVESEYNSNVKADVFNSFYQYMETDVGLVGTSHDKIANAYIQYFREMELPCSASHFAWTNNGKFVEGELLNDRPCHLSLYKHYIYGNHSVLAVGFAKYIYNDDTDSLYIKIADGETNYPNRYVWAGSTSDWCMTSVIPR